MVKSTLTFGLLLCSFLLKANTLAPESVAQAASERTLSQVIYNGAYQSIDYPMGDVSANIGVCTDVVIRAYRALGVDLQEQVHKDMKANFAAYPSKRIWGLTRTDTNIDHRRVPNLRVFFARHGQSLTVSDQPEDYQPGDIVSWRLSNGRPHIGIVSSEKNAQGTRYMIVHNIGLGPKTEDQLFEYDITGHYRYFPEVPKA
ncbi:DUF1287 domain-containing protein [bacterium]|nr:DUF1287 domain-containing protein [bacterium]